MSEPHRDRRSRGALSPPLEPGDPVIRLKGIGPKLSGDLRNEGIETILDLLLHLPVRWQDRTQVARVGDLVPDGRPVLVRGRIGALRLGRRRRRGRGVVQARLDCAGGTIGVVWFNQAWIGERLKERPEVFLFGPVRLDPRSGALQIVNPEVESVDRTGRTGPGIVPVYRKVGALGGRRLRMLMAQAFEALDRVEDPLPGDLLEARGLPPVGTALKRLHQPGIPPSARARTGLIEALNRGVTPEQRRLAFEELVGLAGSVLRMKTIRRFRRAPAYPPVGDPCRVLDLPFELTAAQRRVLAEILGDLARPYPMARLLEGDVGSGKTAVAALAAAHVLHGGGQVAMMAPTELLAEQHMATLTQLFSASPWRPHLLTGSVSAPLRRQVIRELADGTAGLVVGTHALIQEAVGFNRLGLVIIDEQHRFGVAQRQSLIEKGEAPHLLVMTATPIPRSLALTVYGDLDLSILDERPPGRRPVRTVIRSVEQVGLVFEYVAREIADGARAYVVYPLIESSGMIEAEALEENMPTLRRFLPGVTIGMLHGRMSRQEREETYRAFQSGTIQVLAATTVIEVGVDVPEATMMIVASPERFGLSQLHQLRGRVGRGERQSWCVLIAGDRLSAKARHRLELFQKTNDGFELAEADLALRGPGERAGLKQWGADGLIFADIFRDRALLEEAKRTVAELEQRGELKTVMARLILKTRTGAPAAKVDR